MTLSTEPCEAGQRLDQATGCENCPADHWSASGNTAASCTACAAGKEVGAGLGKEAGDCTWSKYFPNFLSMMGVFTAFTMLLILYIMV